eukprot:6487985-Amphidinium_carterae.1
MTLSGCGDAESLMVRQLYVMKLSVVILSCAAHCWLGVWLLGSVVQCGGTNAAVWSHSSLSGEDWIRASDALFVRWGRCVDVAVAVARWLCWAWSPPHSCPMLTVRSLNSTNAKLRSSPHPARLTECRPRSHRQSIHTAVHHEEHCVAGRRWE